MGSYIKFVFKYLFQSDDYLAELERLNGTNSNPPSLLDLNSNLNLNDHQRQQQQPQQTRDSSSSSGSSSGAAPGRQFSSSWQQQQQQLQRRHHQQMSECQLLSHQLIAENNRTNALKSFADFGAFVKQHQQQQLANNNTTLAAGLASATSSGGGASFDALECFNQLQLQDYYAGYDILVGLRIASTLTILFVVFLLFVIYKTGYQAGRSQLSVVSATSYGKSSASSSNRQQLVGQHGRHRHRHRNRGLAPSEKRRRQPEGDSGSRVSASQAAAVGPTSSITCEESSYWRDFGAPPAQQATIPAHRNLDDSNNYSDGSRGAAAAAAAAADDDQARQQQQQRRRRRRQTSSRRTCASSASSSSSSSSSFSSAAAAAAQLETKSTPASRTTLHPSSGGQSRGRPSGRHQPEGLTC